MKENNQNSIICEKAYQKECLILILKDLAEITIGVELKLTELIKKSECLKCAESTLYLLQSLGILKFDGNTVCLKSIHSKFFIKSLEQYIDNDITILTGWEEHKGKSEKINEVNILTAWNFLYSMEKKRFQLLGTSAKVIKNNRIVRVIIKAKINGREQYLMQYDSVAKQYQLIGGYVDISDKNPLAAVVREVSEELPELYLEINETYKLREIYKTEQFEKLISNTYGVLSGYEISLFLAYEMDQKVISMIDRKINCWVSAKEILNRKANDGKKIISISREMLDAMNSCKVSFDKPKFVFSDIISDRRIQLAAGVATILGTGLAVVSFFLK